jgi:two-component system chemotaxis response regulator CheB
VTPLNAKGGRPGGPEALPDEVPDRVLRVLVVDDSAYVRKVVREILSRSPFLEVVGTARDGAEALDRVEELRPDVVTCDLMMPRLDGPEFIGEQMARRPVPIVVISVMGQNEDRVLAALDAGAVDFVQKPTTLATDRMLDMAGELMTKVKAAGRASVRGLVEASRATVATKLSVLGARRIDVVVIGISTGGPQGLKHVIPSLPADCPVPIAVVLHMPVGYTELYAKKLDEVSALAVSEARSGDPLQAGAVVIGRAGSHLKVARDEAGQPVVRLDDEPRDSLHRPSVDVLFRSAAETFGDRVLGVIMTGMGSDGTEGAAWVKTRGGTVVTEAEESCVVYGMPRSVVEAGLSDAAVPLDRMASAIMERL